MIPPGEQPVSTPWWFAWIGVKDPNKRGHQQLLVVDVPGLPYSCSANVFRREGRGEWRAVIQVGDEPKRWSGEGWYDSPADAVADVEAYFAHRSGLSVAELRAGNTYGRTYP